MATRFYFPAEGSGAPDISPAFDAGWEQTGQANRLVLQYKPTLTTTTALANTGTRTVPITTTQDILCNQFVSGPIRPQVIDSGCTVSAVIRALESASTANVFFAIVIKIVSQDGSTVRGVLASNFNTGTEFATGTAATRILPATAVTPLTTQYGDRIVVEIGGHANAPTAGTTYTMRQGTSATSDFALTAALTTDLNPWVEFSSDLFGTRLTNYQFVDVGNGMSTSDKIR